ncbi:alpha-1,2-glucosyltransferase, glycosyltransferase family 59 protein [Pseudohyphozyma bogoriensis]|nr:alpha-1,2-glucosyltransferase, glycosyltransferase family 59 protein [Pseudohyphozyma bogoriensis]
MPSTRYLASYAAFVAAAVYTLNLINSQVPEPYMDEICHTPQAQKYCNGQWREWDSRITTPPGLYIISAALSPIISCTPTNLRLPNTFFLILLPALYTLLLSRLRHPILRPSTRGKTTPSRANQKRVDTREERFEGLAIALFPVLAFFGWLYYTDMVSVVLVLTSYATSLRQRWALSAAAGAASLWFRQTNVAWLAFIAGTAVVHQLETSAELHNPPLNLSSFYDVPHSLVSLALHSLQHLLLLAPIIAAYLPVFVAAAAFVKLNGGIVLGDKSNHVPTIHMTQLWYFSAFAGVFLAPILVSPKAVRHAIGGLAGSVRRVLVSLAMLSVIVWSIKNFTMSHPFLLSDNRHYAFYVWRRVLDVHPYSRYALAPLYLLSTRLIYDRLSSSSTLPLLPLIFYLIALSITLIPSPLIEPRYFLTPFLLLRLHLRPRGTRKERRWRLALEAALHGAVLAGTVAVFVGKTFEWPGEEYVGEKMRFMW